MDLKKILSQQAISTGATPSGMSPKDPVNAPAPQAADPKILMSLTQAASQMDPMQLGQILFDALTEKGLTPDAQGLQQLATGSGQELPNEGATADVNAGPALPPNPVTGQ